MKLNFTYSWINVVLHSKFFKFEDQFENLNYHLYYIEYATRFKIRIITFLNSLKLSLKEPLSNINNLIITFINAVKKTG